MPHVSRRPGMGSIVHSSGATFRVWAPFASRAAVVGSFNNWSARDQDQLSAEGNGFWSADIADAKADDEYRYEFENGSTFTRIDPYAQAVSSSSGNSIIYDSSAYAWKSKFIPPSANELVIYELHVGTFNAPKTSRKRRRHGTFAEAEAKLDYLVDLGVNAIEVLPIHEFPGDLSWGYNPAHLFAVESAYGGPDAFKSLIDSAHSKGIAVILDVVYNHLGPDDCGVWQFDGWSENGMGGIYFFQDERSETPWTKSGRPDYGRDEVRQYIRDNALMWLKEYRIDGLRFDSVSHIRNIVGANDSPSDDIPEGWSLLKWVVEEANRLHPKKYTIAEDLNGNEIITDPQSANGLGFDTQWDKAFADTVRGALIAIEDESRDVPALQTAIERCFSGNAFARVIYTESHDEADKDGGRVPKDIAPKRAASESACRRAILGAALTLTAPGIPMLLQGQEILERDYFDAGRPIDWSLQEKNAGVLQAFRDLIALRTNAGGATRGLTGQQTSILHLNNDSKVIAYLRSDRGGKNDDVVVAANFKNESYSEYEIDVPASGLWHVRFNSNNKQYAEGFGDSAVKRYKAATRSDGSKSYTIKLELGPYSLVILSQGG